MRKVDVPKIVENTSLIGVAGIIIYGRSGRACDYEVSGVGSRASSQGGNDVALDGHSGAK